MLEGDLAATTVPSFISTFSNISRCCLNITNDRCDLSEILKNLSPRLRKLDVVAEPTSSPVDELVLAYQELTSLKLSGDVFTLNLFLNLHQLPQLASLSLDYGPHITLDSVQLLLSGPTEIRTLKKLKLFQDSLDCEYGASYLDPHHHFFLNETARAYDPVGWKLPSWSDEFPREDVEVFLGKATEAGVKVGYHLQEAMEIEDAYEVEVEQCRIYSQTVNGRLRMERMLRTARVRLRATRGRHGSAMRITASWRGVTSRKAEGSA